MITLRTTLILLVGVLAGVTAGTIALWASMPLLVAVTTGSAAFTDTVVLVNEIVA